MKKNKPRKRIKLNWWSDPIIRFIITAGLVLLLLLLISSLRNVESFLIQFTSFILSKLLDLFHIPYEPSNLGSQFAFQILDGSKLKFVIIPDCTGIYPLAILISFIIGYPSTWTQKFAGMALAILCTALMNFSRLTLLIQIGRESLSSFNIWHTLIWQSSFLLLLVFFYFGWIKWIGKTA